MEEQHYQLLDGKAVSAQMKKEMAEEGSPDQGCRR